MQKKAARDGARGPVKKNTQGWDPRTHERKSSANNRQSCDFNCSSNGEEESENPMRVITLEELVLNYRVGESGDRSVRAGKVLQQAETNEDSATQS